MYAGYLLWNHLVSKIQQKLNEKNDIIKLSILWDLLGFLDSKNWSSKSGF